MTKLRCKTKAIELIRVVIESCGKRIRMFNSKFKLRLTSLVHCMLTERCCLTAGYKWKCNIYHYEGLQTVRVDWGHALYPQNNHQPSAVELQLRHSSSKISRTHTREMTVANYRIITLIQCATATGPENTLYVSTLATYSYESYLLPEIEQHTHRLSRISMMTTTVEKMKKRKLLLSGTGRDKNGKLTLRHGTWLAMWTLGYS